jgi:hypothetical protein
MQITHKLSFNKKRKPMEVNYLHMIWDVKILLAKIKDGKGKDLNFLNKKSLLTIIRPKIPRTGYF